YTVVTPFVETWHAASPCRVFYFQLTILTRRKYSGQARLRGGFGSVDFGRLKSTEPKPPRGRAMPRLLFSTHDFNATEV
ncbi:MAG: hypothetical protein LBD35_05490, partial [Prevotellaceae bacterium]|nr:hypothetical protein [Prevotellaceae bacterium]